MFQGPVRSQQKSEFQQQAANIRPDEAKSVVTAAAVAGSIETTSDLTDIHKIAEKAGTKIRQRGAEIGADGALVEDAIAAAKHSAISKGEVNQKSNDPKKSGKGELGNMQDGLAPSTGLAARAIWQGQEAQDVPNASALKISTGHKVGQPINQKTRQPHQVGVAEGLETPEAIAQSTGTEFPRISRPGTYIPRPQNANAAQDVDQIALRISGKPVVRAPVQNPAIAPETQTFQPEFASLTFTISSADRANLQNQNSPVGAGRNKHRQHDFEPRELQAAA